MTILRQSSFDNVSHGNTIDQVTSGFDNINASPNPFTGAVGLKGAGSVRYTGTVQGTFQWNFPARTSLYSRGYIKVTNSGTANHTFVWLNNTADSITTRVAEVRFRSSQLDFQIRNSAAVAVATSSAFSLGDVIRWEWFVDRAAQTQTLRLFTGANIDGTSPSQTISGSTGTGSASFTQFNLGSQLVQSGTPEIIFDEVAIGDDWIGPWQTSTPVSSFEFLEWNGTTLTPLSIHEWNGTALAELEIMEN